MTFAPTDLAGLQLWLKADSLGLADGAAVTTWADSSGLGNNASVGVAPTYKAGIVNGLPVVRFASGNFLNTTAPASQAAETLFLVFRPSGAGFRAPLGATNAGGGRNLYVDNATGKMQLDADGVVAISTSSTPISISVFSVFAYDFAAATSWHDFLNGTADGANTTPNSFTNARLTAIGRSDPGSPNYFTGDIAEVLIYNSVLSSTDRGSVHNYLLVKYGFIAAPTTGGAPHVLSAQARDAMLSNYYARLGEQAHLDRLILDDEELLTTGAIR